MAAASRGMQAFERARPAAAEAPRLRARPPRQPDPGRRPEPTASSPGPSTNFTALHEALAAAEPRRGGLNLKAAVEQAAEMLARRRRGAKELVVVSDFQRCQLGVGRLLAAAERHADPAGIGRGRRGAGQPRGPAGRAAGPGRAGARGAAGGGRRQLLRHAARRAGGRERRRRVVAARRPLPAGREDDAVGRMRPSAGGLAGGRGEARRREGRAARPTTPGRSCWTSGRRRRSRWSPASSSKPQATSSHFLELALAAGQAARRRRPAERVVRVDPAALDRDAVAAADLIVLDHPGRLCGGVDQAAGVAAAPGPAGAVRRRRARRRDQPGAAGRGGGFGPEDAGAVRPARRRPGAAGPVPSHPPARSPACSPSSATNSTPPSPRCVSPAACRRRLDTGLADDVLATYSDQSAALVVTACGAGTLAVLNASLADSNLPGSPVFVPLTGELVDRLLGRSRSGEAAASGELAVTYLPPEAGGPAGLTVHGPGGDADTGELSDENGSAVWRWAAAGTPGVYTVRRGAANVFAPGDRHPRDRGRPEVDRPGPAEGTIGRRADRRLRRRRGGRDPTRHPLGVGRRGLRGLHVVRARGAQILPDLNAHDLEFWTVFTTETTEHTEKTAKSRVNPPRALRAPWWEGILSGTL